MKKSCKDCIFFKDKFLVNGNPYSCSDFGVRADEHICGDFDPIHKKDPLYVKVNVELDEKEKEQPFRIDQKQNLFNIIKEVFDYEKDTAQVIEEIQNAFDAQGVYLPFDSKKIEEYTEKLSSLYTLYKLSLAWGLTSYTDEIMSKEIDKLFKGNSQDIIKVLNEKLRQTKSQNPV